MKFGANCPTAYWTVMKELGYDYIEGNFAVIAEADDEAFRKLLDTRCEAALDVEAANCFFPATPDLYGEDLAKTLTRLSAYAEKGFERAKMLGCEIAVIGSGRARSVPDGVERAAAEERFLSVLNMLGDLASDYGIRIALEPLSFAETNFIHTVGEAAALCEKLGHGSVGTMIDFFHAWSNGDPIESLQAAKPWVFHAHIARPNRDRKIPTVLDADACKSWADALSGIGYDTRLSLEAIWSENITEDLKTAREAMQIFCRK